MKDGTTTQLPEIVRDLPWVSPGIVKRATPYAASILADPGRRGAQAYGALKAGESL